MKLPDISKAQSGQIVLPSEQTAVDELATRISQAMAERGETLESMLKALREERDRTTGPNPEISY
ncbi:MAG TPA: hypothetical protein VMW27_27030 [Thermoanaerobaculia bacterium]|nr:hypothetical protein [Thermoanaerobaculia bacterium]